jgi:hypothetical protein
MPKSLAAQPCACAAASSLDAQGCHATPPSRTIISLRSTILAPDPILAGRVRSQVQWRPEWRPCGRRRRLPPPPLRFSRLRQARGGSGRPRPSAQPRAAGAAV